MKRWQRVLLLFSLALNISFVSIAATHFARTRDEGDVGTPDEVDVDTRGQLDVGQRGEGDVRQRGDGDVGQRGDLRRRGEVGRAGARGAPALERWHTRRHKRFGERLQLDPAQQEIWNTQFGALAPQIAAARLDIVAARDAYHGTLLDGDAGAIRVAAHRVSLAQVRLDSLCAEAMAAEAASLRPDQRARYVRWLKQPPRFPGRMRPERDVKPTAAGRAANDDRKDAP